MGDGWIAFRVCWAALHPLSHTRRRAALEILQPLAEIQVPLEDPDYKWYLCRCFGTLLHLKMQMPPVMDPEELTFAFDGGSSNRLERKVRKCRHNGPGDP